MLTSSSPTLNSTAPAGSDFTMSALRRAGTTAAPSDTPPTVTVSRIVELQIGAGDRQLVARDLQVDPCQHGQRAGATGGGPTGRRQRVGEDITFTAELHSRPFP